MNHTIWGKAADILSQRFTLHLVDLPGHGEAHASVLGKDTSGFAAQLAADLPGAMWLGWSLGGMITLQALKQPNIEVRAAILVGTNPSFTRRAHWRHGVDGLVFDTFKSSLSRDPEATLDRFLALESQGSINARDCLRKVRDSVQSHPPPNPGALSDGLDILQLTDLTASLGQLASPCHWITGSDDQLVPSEASRQAAQLMPRGSFQCFEGAGHVPFLSHPTIFAKSVAQFMEQWA